MHIKPRHLNDFPIELKFHSTDCLHEKITNPNNNIETCTTNIEVVQSYKYLGVYVDNNFKWKIHIEDVRKKLRKSAYILYHLSNCSTYSVLRQAYFSLAETYVRHGITAWGSATYCKTLQKTQNQILKILWKSHRYNDTITNNNTLAHIQQQHNSITNNTLANTNLLVYNATNTSINNNIYTTTNISTNNNLLANVNNNVSVYINNNTTTHNNIFSQNNTNNNLYTTTNTSTNNSFTDVNHNYTFIYNNSPADNNIFLQNNNNLSLNITNTTANNMPNNINNNTHTNTRSNSYTAENSTNNTNINSTPHNNTLINNINEHFTNNTQNNNHPTTNNTTTHISNISIIAKELKLLNVKSIYYTTLSNVFFNDSRFLHEIDHIYNTRRRAQGRYKVEKFSNEYGRNTLGVTLPTILNKIPSITVNTRNTYRRKKLIKEFFISSQ